MAWTGIGQLMDNLLLIRLKAIGDVIFTLPAVGALRENFPAAKISFLVSKENAGLLAGFREVNEVIALDRAALRSGNPFKMGLEFVRLLHRMRVGKFSLVVDFQGFGETAWLARLTGAPKRWGSVYGHGRRWAYTRAVRRNERMHPADWNLKLLDDCGVGCGAVRNEFSLPDDALAMARNFFLEQQLAPGEPTLVIQPFTSSAQKNWPLENFLTVARHWRARGVQVIFCGGPADGPRLEPARAEKFCTATGLPLLVSAGLVQLAALLLGGDTGLGHLAVAQGRRVVMLMMHKETGACIPYRHPDWAVVPQVPGQIRDIAVETVLAETGKVLQRGDALIA
jgi:ADP-heptose:LPS heptosyltransferase